MPLTTEEIKELISNFEGETFDCKSIEILSHPDDLARLMVAFGNNKFVSEDFGGRIIIGVDNNHNIENFQPKQGHEEAIMNVARDKCHPSIRPLFEKVDMDKKIVYVVTIPKMNNIPFQLITGAGKTFRIRVGSTIREPTSNELEVLFDKSQSLDDTKLSILQSFPQNFEPTRHITIIPLDLNSTMINFNRDNTEFLRTRRPKYITTEKTKLVQNEFHYDGRDYSFKSYGIINELGVYSIVENIDSQPKLIHAGREVLFLFSIFYYITNVYRHFNYNQRIRILYTHTRVENFKFGTDDISDPINFEGYRAQKSTITIERIVSLSSLNFITLIGSILEEFVRACDGALDQGELDPYIRKIHDEHFPNPIRLE